MKKVFAAILSIALIAGVSACGEKKAEGPDYDYADDEAMSIIAEGFSKRSSLIDKLKGQGKDTSELSISSKGRVRIRVNQRIFSRSFRLRLIMTSR